MYHISKPLRERSEPKTPELDKVGDAVSREWRRLPATVTAFTVAHRIAMAAATIGFVP